jgi:hypothetical protein
LENPENRVAQGMPEIGNQTISMQQIELIQTAADQVITLYRHPTLST